MFYRTSLFYFYSWNMLVSFSVDESGNPWWQHTNGSVRICNCKRFLGDGRISARGQLRIRCFCWPSMNQKRNQHVGRESVIKIRLLSILDTLSLKVFETLCACLYYALCVSPLLPVFLTTSISLIHLAPSTRCYAYTHYEIDYGNGWKIVHWKNADCIGVYRV